VSVEAAAGGEGGGAALALLPLPLPAAFPPTLPLRPCIPLRWLCGRFLLEGLLDAAGAFAARGVRLHVLHVPAPVVGLTLGGRTADPAPSGAVAVVVDCGYTRVVRSWRDSVAAAIPVPLLVVSALPHETGRWRRVFCTHVHGFADGGLACTISFLRIRWYAGRGQCGGTHTMRAQWQRRGALQRHIARQGAATVGTIHGECGCMRCLTAAAVL